LWLNNKIKKEVKMNAAQRVEIGNRGVKGEPRRVPVLTLEVGKNCNSLQFSPKGNEIVVDKGELRIVLRNDLFSGEGIIFSRKEIAPLRIKGKYDYDWNYVFRGCNIVAYIWSEEECSCDLKEAGGVGWW
jgi:hypothetical protein